MAYPVTLNGRTYTLADFEGTNYVDGFPDALEDFVTQAGNIYTTTSTSSVAIGTGSKTFTVADSGKPYIVGTPLRIADSAAPSTNWIDGIVTSYSGTTLVVDAIAYAGSGTKTSWNINIGGSAIAYTGTLPIAQGGTGATTASAARTNLDVYSKSEADGRYINVTGDGMTSNLTFGDNVKATFGASADLEIFHDGAASYIRDAGTGNLRLEGNVVVTDSPDSNDGKITFGDATNAQGVVFYDYSLGDLILENTWADATADIILKANSAEIMRSNSTGTVFNEAGADMDFRVESDSRTHMLFVDGGNNRVGIGISAPESTLDVFGTSSSTALFLRSGDVDSGINGGVQVRFSYDQGTSYSHAIKTRHNASGANDNAITFYTWSPSDASGAVGSTRVLDLTSTEAVVNENSSAGVDFRVETDANTHALFVDASENKVRMGYGGSRTAFHGSAPVQIGNTSFHSQANSGSGVYDTGIKINQDNAGGVALVMASNNTGAGNATAGGLWLIKFPYDGSFGPTVYHIGGSNFLTFGGTGGGNLTWQNPGGGNCEVFIMVQ